MALVGNAKFSLKASDVSNAIRLFRGNPKFFDNDQTNREKAMLELARGDNYVKAIKAWLQAASLIGKGKGAVLTNYALMMHDCDPEFNNSNTWWAIHLLLCFSNDASPYKELFRSFELSSGGWVLQQELKQNVIDTVKRNCESTKLLADNSISTSYDGVITSFNLDPDRPLSNLGLIETMSINGKNYRKSGSVNISDATFVFALSLARSTYFSSESSIDFSQIYEIGLHTYLGCSRGELASKAAAVSSNIYWSDYFSYDRAANLDSISFKEKLSPKSIVQFMLREKVEGWM